MSRMFREEGVGWVLPTAIAALCLCTAATAQTFPLTRTDALGQKVTLPAPPRRIVSLAPSNTELLFALGLGYANMSVEQIVSLSPDLVLAVYGNPDWMLSRLRDLSVPVFGLNPVHLSDVPDGMLLVAEICGVASAGKQLAARFHTDIAAVTAAIASATRHPRVYFGAWEPPFFSPGPGSFIYDMVELAGGENLTRYYEKNWVSLNLEDIVERDPEIIIHGLEGVPTNRAENNSAALEMLGRRAGWRITTAVKTGRVYLLDDNLVQRPGPRLQQGLAALARAIHPECFEKKP